MHNWKEYAKNGPIVALAPMDGYTDSAYRQVVKHLCPQSAVFCEFVSADGLSRARNKMRRLVDFNPQTERPYAVQMFGKNPESFAEAARFLVDEMDVDAIDINYGCPARKVVGSGHGSDLIRHPDLAWQVVAATVKAVEGRVPVSVKTRLGWADSSTLNSFVAGIVAAGASLLTVHGRTVAQAFTGTADWADIYALKDLHPDLPILGNGDVVDGASAIAKLGNLDGIMIGRASMGNPWIIQEAYAALHGLPWQPPTPAERAEVIKLHAKLLIDTKGNDRATKEFRKHLLSHTKGFAGAREMRADMTSVECYEDIVRVADKVCAGMS